MAAAFAAWAAGSSSEFASEPIGELPTEIHAAAGVPLRFGEGGDYRRSVSHFILGEKSRITLVGHKGAKFILNVSGDFELSGAVLALEGGLLPADVLFNLTSTSLQMRRRIVGDSVFFGNIVTTGVPVTISNSTVNGRKIPGSIEKAVVAPLAAPPKLRGPVGP